MSKVVKPVEPEIRMVNVVATVKVGQEINLRKVLEKVPQAEYDPKRFPGLVYRLNRPKTAILIFGSGNMVVTGAKSESDVYKAVDKLISMLTSKKIIGEVRPIVKIENVVAAGNLMCGVDLEKAADVLEMSIYEPEEFPGLIYTIRDPKVVILLFASGKFVCTGARGEKYVYEAIQKLRKELEEKDLIF